MKAKALKPFIDKKEGVTRNVGDTFTLSKERYEEINSTKHGIMVMAVAEETAKPTKTPKRKGGSKK
jgi:hypothetical protein